MRVLLAFLVGAVAGLIALTALFIRVEGDRWWLPEWAVGWPLVGLLCGLVASRVVAGPWWAAKPPKRPEA